MWEGNTTHINTDLDPRMGLQPGVPKSNGRFTQALHEMKQVCKAYGDTYCVHACVVACICVLLVTPTADKQI